MSNIISPGPERSNVITLPDGRTFAVDRIGLVRECREWPTAEPPAINQVELAERWLTERIGDGRVGQPNASSYTLDA